MALRYKVDVLTALKHRGWTTYRLRSEKILGEGTIQRLREGRGVSWDALGVLCKLLECQPGDLVEYVDGHADPGEEIPLF